MKAFGSILFLLFPLLALGQQGEILKQDEYKELSKKSETQHPFRENKGQFRSEVKFQYQSGNKIIQFLEDRIVFGLAEDQTVKSTKDSLQDFYNGVIANSPRGRGMIKYFVWNLHFQNCRKATPKGEFPSESYINIFHGNINAINVYEYSRIRYKNLYDKIDLVFYIVNGQLKYDIELQSNAELSQVQLLFEGVDKLKIERDSLFIHTQKELISETIPYSYSQRAQRTFEEKLTYVLHENKLGFAFKDGSRKKPWPVTIDPIRWTCGTYFGDSTYRAITDIRGIDNDSSGNIYICGSVSLYMGGTVNNLPLTPGTYDSLNIDQSEAFVSKFNSDLSELIYSTYLGGQGIESGDALCVDQAGFVYLSGHSGSFNQNFHLFPFTYRFGPNILSLSYGFAGYVAKFNKSGDALLYSSILTTTLMNRPSSIDVNHFGEAFITGVANGGDLALTSNALLNSNQGLYVSKFSATGASLLYSSYVSAIVGSPLVQFVQVYERDLVFLMTTGHHWDWPLASNPYKRGSGQHHTQFVKLNIAAAPSSQVIYGTHLGAFATESPGYFSIVNKNEIVFTYGSADPIVDFSLNQANGEFDVIVGKLNFLKDSAHCLERTRYVGTSGDEVPRGISIDANADIYILYGSRPASSKKSLAILNLSHGNYNLKILKLDTCLQLLDSMSIGGDWDDLTVGKASTGGTFLKLQQKNDQVLLNAVIYSNSIDLPVSPNAFQKILPNSRTFLKERDTIAMPINFYYCTAYQFQDTFIPKPRLNLGNGPDTLICNGSSINLDAGDWNKFEWNGSATENVRFFSSSDSGMLTLWVEAHDRCSRFRDTLSVKFSTLHFDISAPTYVCYDSIFLLDASVSGLKYAWSTSDSTQKITADSGGIFWVDVTNECETKRDSVYIRQLLTPVKQLPSDTIFCQDFNYNLSAKDTSLNYAWNTLDSSSAILADTAGLYILKAWNACGESIDSILITRFAKPEISFPKDSIICDKVDMLVKVESPQLSYSRISWNSSSTDTLPSYQINTFGTHSVSVSNFCGTTAGFFKISKDSLPVFDLGSDSTFCDQITISLNAFASNADSFIWNSADKTASINPKVPGFYKVTAYNRCGSRSDSIQLKLLYTPFVELGKDTVYCGKVKHELNAYFPTAKYSWSNGDTSASIKINKAGNYDVVLSNYCGTATDGIFIGSSPNPKLNLGRDTIICTELKYMLDAGEDGQIYNWNPASSNSRYMEVREYSTYRVEVINEYLCRSEDSIKISDWCPPQVFIPKAFTPNGYGDERNESFHIESRFLEKMHLIVFNRWGEIVFETRDPKAGWDGTLSGKPCQEGIYYYLISIAGHNYEQNLNGYFMLLR